MTGNHDPVADLSDFINDSRGRIIVNEHEQATAGLADQGVKPIRRSFEDFGRRVGRRPTAAQIVP